MRTPWTGVGTALVTPFTRSGALDEAAVRRLTRRQIDAGIHFLVPCGTTGESPTLSEDERIRVVELVVEEANGKVPVLGGAGGYDTREVIHTAQRMKRAGARGILSVTPYYNKPTPEGLFQHYSAIAGDVGLPLVVYNVPGRTGCNVDVATLVRLAGVPGIVGVKEASAARSGRTWPPGRTVRSTPSNPAAFTALPSAFQSRSGRCLENRQKGRWAWACPGACFAEEATGRHAPAASAAAAARIKSRRVIAASG